MEFHEKMQELRKQRGLTQEELAEALYVSRTAISKWESGRGYPNIESLKAISKFYSVSLDDLLSGDALLTIAEEEGRQKERNARSLIFGLLDCCMALLLFLPVFGQRGDGLIREVSMLSLAGVEPYIKLPYFAVVSALIVWGVLELALQNHNSVLWLRSREKVSLGLSAAAALLFAATLQPYATMIAFVFLLIKALMLIKWT